MDIKEDYKDKLRKMQNKYDYLSLETVSALCNAGHNAASNLINNDNNGCNKKIKAGLDALEDKDKMLLSINNVIDKGKIKNIKQLKYLEKIKKNIITKNEIIGSLNKLMEYNNSTAKLVYKIGEYCEMFIKNLELEIFQFKDKSIKEQLTICTTAAINKKISKLFHIYNNESKEDILNTLICEKAEQFTINRLLKNILPPIEEVKSLIIDIEQAEKELNNTGYFNISQILKRMKALYKMTYEDMGIVLNFSKDTVKRTITEKMISPTLRDNAEDIWKLFCDTEKMKEIIKSHKGNNKINTSKILSAMKSKEFEYNIILEGFMQANYYMLVHNIEFLTLFTQAEMSPERKKVQNYIDETEFIVNNTANRNRSYKINLYKETIDKINELQKKYPQYEKEDIVYEILCRQIDLYVTFDFSQYKEEPISEDEDKVISDSQNSILQKI